MTNLDVYESRLLVEQVHQDVEWEIGWKNRDIHT